VFITTNKFDRDDIILYCVPFVPIILGGEREQLRLLRIAAGHLTPVNSVVLRPFASLLIVSSICWTWSKPFSNKRNPRANSQKSRRQRRRRVRDQIGFPGTNLTSKHVAVFFATARPIGRPCPFPVLSIPIKPFSRAIFPMSDKHEVKERIDCKSRVTSCFYLNSSSSRLLTRKWKVFCCIITAASATHCAQSLLPLTTKELFGRFEAALWGRY